MTKVLLASAGSTAGKRGRSLGSTSGSAARTDAQARQKVKRSGRMRNFTKFAGERPHNARGRKILAEQSGTVEMAEGFGGVGLKMWKWREILTIGARKPGRR